MYAGTGRRNALRWLPVVGIVVLVLVGCTIYLARLTNELRATLSKLDTAAARLELALEAIDTNAVARSAGEHFPGVCADDQGVPAMLEELRDKVRDLTRGVADIQFELQPDAPIAKAGSGRGTGPATDALPLPLAPRILGMGVGPAHGVGAGSVALGAHGISEEARSHLEWALRGQAARVRQRVEMEAIDPENPDPGLLLRVMEESQEELMNEMRGAVNPKDFDALFPFQRSRDRSDAW